MTDPTLKRLTVFTANATNLDADTTVGIGGFTNTITIRRFIETVGAAPTGTSPTTALNIDDAGAAGAGTTAVADKAAAALTALVAATTEANNTNAADGYRLAAGNTLKVLIDVGGTTPVFPGYTLVMEYAEGIG